MRSTFAAVTFRLILRTFEIELTSGGAQHGMCFDDWGRKFVSSNSDHIQQIMYEDRYVARNPRFSAPSARVSIAADGPQAEVYRTSPVEPWRIVRTRLRVGGLVPGPIEGRRTGRRLLHRCDGRHDLSRRCLATTMERAGNHR